jgi:anaerobic selenocysteine-containing dehydrogenase
MFDAVADGRIKALWIMATNPVDSMPGTCCALCVREQRYS